MAGYDDTRAKIINTLMGRPNGTEIQPENHQDYALNMLDYIRSLELDATSTLIGIADEDTVPIQPNASNVCYIAGVAQDRTVTFQNFRDYQGEPLSITTGEMQSYFVILLWNKQYWSMQALPTAIVSQAETAYFYYRYTIRQTYPSFEAMEADKSNPVGIDGRYIKQGEIVSVVNDSDESKNGFYSYTGSGWQFQSSFSFQIENSFDINNDSELNTLLDGLHGKVEDGKAKAGYFRGDYEGSPFMVESIPINYTEDTWVQSVRGRFVPVYQGTVDKIKTLTRSNTEYNILWRVCEKGTWGTWNSMTDAPTIPDTDLSMGLKDGDETSGYMQMLTRKGGCYSVTGSRTGVVTGTMMVFCDSWGEHGIEQVLFTDASDIEGKIVHDISSSGHVDGEPRIYHRYYDIRQSGGKWGAWKSSGYGVGRPAKGVIGGEIFNDYENNTVSGDYAHAEGQGCSANGDASHAEGFRTIVENDCEHAEGCYNVSNTGTRHSIGIGTSESDRRNALEVMDDGRVYVKGVGGYDGVLNEEEDRPLQDVLEALFASEYASFDFGVLQEKIGSGRTQSDLDAFGLTEDVWAKIRGAEIMVVRDDANERTYIVTGSSDDYISFAYGMSETYEGWEIKQSGNNYIISRHQTQSNTVAMTQEEYDALEEKDDGTFYFIYED